MLSCVYFQIWVCRAGMVSFSVPMACVSTWHGGVMETLIVMTSRMKHTVVSSQDAHLYNWQTRRCQMMRMRMPETPSLLKKDKNKTIISDTLYGITQIDLEV